MDDETGESEWEIVAKTCICFERRLWEQASSKLKQIDSAFSENKTSSMNIGETRKEHFNASLNYLKT